jgi:hypothetical protein
MSGVGLVFRSAKKLECAMLLARVGALAVAFALAGCLSIDDAQAPGRDASVSGSDAGPDSAPDALTDASDDGDSGSGESVSCGSSVCPLPAQFCCQYLDTATHAPTCQAPSEACTSGTYLSCDGPEDCAGGEVCCGTIVPYGGFESIYGTVTCVAAAQCDLSKNMRVFCGNDAGACPSGLSCKPSTILSSYRVCQS